MLLLATLLAGDTVGFKLTSFAQSQDDELAQLNWEKRPRQEAYTQPHTALEFARGAAAHYLKEKSEPASYQQIHAAAITHLATESKLSVDTLLENTSQAASETNSLIETLFYQPGLLSRIGGGTASLETGAWWLAGGVEPEIPLIDRVEEVILQHLVEAKTTSSSSVKTCVYRAFPGIFTPENEVILNCLESYADLIDPENHQWSLRGSEQPKARKADMDAIHQTLQQIGGRLNYRISGMNPLIWEDADDPSPIYQFHILTTAIMYPHIHHTPAGHYNVLVIPGSRANLLAYKQQRDPLLRRKLDQNFLIMKFRLVRDLEANSLLSRELFKEQILADPPEYQTSQLALF
jgi:hypothetical protein